MRSTTVGLLAAVAATMLTFQVSAAEGPAPKGRPFRPETMLPRMDKNQDGKVTADEVPDAAPEFVKELLKRADKNGDKAVTAEELREAIPKFRGGEPHRPEAGLASPRPGGSDGPQALGFVGRGAPEGRRPQPSGLGPDMAWPSRSGFGFGGPSVPSPESRPDPKAFFARLDKDGDQELSVDEFAEGMKLFHSQAMAARRPMLRLGPMGFHPEMGRPPMAGRGPTWPHYGLGHGRMAGRPPMMGRPPMLGTRGEWGRLAWTKSPWAQQAWGRPSAAWAKHRGPMAGHPGAMLGRLQSLDKDKDGKLSKSETPERLQQHFHKIDANKDGQLDKAELGKAFHAFNRQSREAVAERRAQIGKKMHEARETAAEKKHVLKQEGEKKHAKAKKPREKKGEEKKS